MHGIILALKESNLFKSIEVIDFIDEESIKLLRIKVKILDGTLLYITELHTVDYQKYSYHWQKENGELIIRWIINHTGKILEPFHIINMRKIKCSHRIESILMM